MSDADFNAAADQVKNLKKKPGDNEMLEVYGLYKQATVGDCNTDRPGMTDLKGKAKWDSWNGKKGMSKDDAKSKYIELSKTLAGKYN